MPTHKRKTCLVKELLVHERELWNGGFSFLAGIDEAGRGCLAGPVVAAAVVFTDRKSIPAGLDDSKKLSPERREELRNEIMENKTVRWAVAEISASDIDRFDILRSTWKAMTAAVNQLLPLPQFILVDGNPVPGLPLPSRNIVKGDACSASIAAASIMAKTHRDHWMTAAAEQYPGYGFEVHKGYGTAMHLEALKKLGPCPLHRMTFAPVREILYPPEFIQQNLL